MNKSPAYVRVYNTLKTLILEEEYKTGQVLPTEPMLEKQFGVSRTTVRKAIGMLSQEGYVRAMQGRGTEVLNYNAQQNLNTLTSLSETLTSMGYSVYTRSMQIDRVAATERLASELQIEVGTPVVRIKRLQMADESPIAIMHNYILPAFVPHIELFNNRFTRFYAFLEDQYNIHLDGAKDSISARSASFEEAEMLSVAVGSALLCLNRVCFVNGEPVCADHIRIVGGRYAFEIALKGRLRR